MSPISSGPEDMLRDLRAAAYARPDFVERAEQARTGDPVFFTPAGETIIRSG